jgi:hypothetical protein
MPTQGTSNWDPYTGYKGSPTEGAGKAEKAARKRVKKRKRRNKKLLKQHAKKVKRRLKDKAKAQGIR